MQELGQAFSSFLKQMAEHNAKIACPSCGKTHEYSLSDAIKPPARM